MKADSKDALGLALELMQIEPPSDGSWHFLNASPVPGLDPAWKQALVCEQAFRPEFINLERLGYQARPSVKDNNDQTCGAIVLLGRNRLLNEHRIASAWKTLANDGCLVVAGNKKDGIGSIRKWFSNHCDISDSISKYHAIVFRAIKQDGASLPVQDLKKVMEGYRLAEGMFSSEGPDKGSRLLANHFGERMVGKIADLGAGWGYLSARLLEKSSQVTELDLFEADHNALDAAKTNVTSECVDLSFNWVDVVSEFPKKPFDWVIMNPPFHSGRAAVPGLGQCFIEVAASTLPRGGRLLMVANRNLPYEKAIDTHFRKFEKLEEHDGFKVIEALR